MIMNIRKRNFSQINMKINGSSSSSNRRGGNPRAAGFNIFAPGHRSETNIMQLAQQAGISGLSGAGLTNSTLTGILNQYNNAVTSLSAHSNFNIRDIIGGELPENLSRLQMGQNVDEIDEIGINVDMDEFGGNGSPFPENAIFSLGANDRRMMREMMAEAIFADGPSASGGYGFTGSNTANQNQTAVQNTVMISQNQPVNVSSAWNPVDNSWIIASGSNSTKPKKDMKKVAKDESVHETSLAEDLFELDQLWVVLGDCLEQFDKSGDANAFLIVQNAVEAFFMVHSLDKKEVEFKKKRLEEEKATKDAQKASEDVEKCMSEAIVTNKPESTKPESSEDSNSNARPDSGKNLIIDTSLPDETQKFLQCVQEFVLQNLVIFDLF